MSESKCQTMQTTFSLVCPVAASVERDEEGRRVRTDGAGLLEGGIWEMRN